MKRRWPVFAVVGGLILGGCTMVPVTSSVPP
ncbi:MAG: hypothetical protein JWN15_3094, partial [Firmicutes bacterium]|nr:hypothetical protein [Bacillota bacterium]